MITIAGEEGSLVSEELLMLILVFESRENGSGRMDQCKQDPICPVKCGAPMGSEVKTETKAG